MGTHENVNSVLNALCLLMHAFTEVKTLTLYFAKMADTFANVSGLKGQLFIQGNHQSPGSHCLGEYSTLLNFLLFQMIYYRKHVSKCFSAPCWRCYVMNSVVVLLE